MRNPGFMALLVCVVFVGCASEAEKAVDAYVDAQKCAISKRVLIVETMSGEAGWTDQVEVLWTCWRTKKPGQIQAAFRDAVVPLSAEDKNELKEYFLEHVRDELQPLLEKMGGPIVSGEGMLKYQEQVFKGMCSGRFMPW